MYSDCVAHASQDTMACTFRPSVAAELAQVSLLGCARRKQLSARFRFEEMSHPRCMPQ